MLKYKHLVIMAGAILMMASGTSCSNGTIADTKEQLSGSTGTLEEPVEEPGDASGQPVAGDGFTIEKQSGQDGYDTPEQAVQAYLEALMANDLKQLAETFSHESSAEDDLYGRITEEKGLGLIVDNLQSQHAILCGLGLTYAQPVSLKGGEIDRFLEEMTEKLHSVNYSSMKILGFIPLESILDVNESEAHRNNLTKLAQNYGVDQLESRMVCIEVNGKQYVLFFDLVNYGNRWYSLESGGSLSKMAGLDASISGMVELDTEDIKVIKGLLVPAESQPRSGGATVAESLKTGDPDLKTESQGYESPEEAAKFFLDGFKACNLSQMMSSFAIESYTEQYDLQSNLEETGAYIYNRQEFDLPSVDNLTREINKQKRKSKIADDIIKQYAAIFLLNSFDPGGASSGDIIADEKEMRIVEEIRAGNNLSALKELLDILDFKSLSILGYITPSSLSDRYNSEANQEHMAQMAKIYGADRIESSILVFELAGKKYYLCMDAIEYNGRWYNRQPGGQMSVMLGIPTDFMGIMPVIEQEGKDTKTIIKPFS